MISKDYKLSKRRVVNRTSSYRRPNPRVARSGSRSKKKPFIGRGLKIVVVVVLLIAIGISGSILYYNHSIEAPDKNSKTTKQVKINKGDTLDIIAAKLEKNELINSKLCFKIKAKMLNKEASMQPGSYTLSRALSNEEIINIFSVGRKSKTIIFPEGYTVRDVAAKLEKERILPADTFINACQNYKGKYKFLKGVDIKKFKLEGFLFPATYQISENATNKDIVELFLKGFATNFKQENYAILKEKKLTMHELLTIASLIEKEAALDKDRAKIASVIYNRLKKGMKLQFCATVQYALGKHKQKLYYKDLKIDSPYNTYKIKGLPPGPICSPGIKSIEAALHPANTDYLYYVVKAGGSMEHVFSNNYKDFENNKSQYLNSINQ